MKPELEQSERTIDSETRAGPGAILKRARERRNLTVDDVAAKLYLTCEHINLIEANDYSKTLGLMFERGYLRSYSRLLGIDETAIIQAFNDLKLVDNRASLPHGMTVEPITSRRVLSKWLLPAAMTFLVVVAVGAWLAMKPSVQVNAKATPLAAEQTQEATSHDVLVTKALPIKTVVSSKHHKS